jgi:hypothetical protein
VILAAKPPDQGKERAPEYVDGDLGYIETSEYCAVGHGVSPWFRKEGKNVLFWKKEPKNFFSLSAN